MRRIHAGLLVLILALNGIACACPLAAADSDPDPHATHHVKAETGKACHAGECDESCDGTVASRIAAAAPLAQGNSLFPDLDDDSPATLVTELAKRWRSSLQSSLVPLPLRLRALATPVSLRDRMLD